MRKINRFAQANKARTAALIAVAMLLWVVAAPASAAASDRWFHVRVDDRSTGGAEVSVNLPLNLIEMALNMIPEEFSQEVSDEVQVELNDAGFDVSQLRDLWNEIRDGQDATYLTVDSDEANVAVRKEGRLPRGRDGRAAR